MDISSPKDSILIKNPIQLLFSYYILRKKRNDELIQVLYEFFNNIVYVGRNKVKSKKYPNLYKVLFSPTYHVWGKEYTDERPYFVLIKIVDIVKKYGIHYPELVKILYDFKIKLEIDYQWTSNENIVIPDLSTFDDFVKDFLTKLQDYIEKISKQNRPISWLISDILKFLIVPFITVSFFFLVILCVFYPILFQYIKDQIITYYKPWLVIFSSIILGLLTLLFIYKGITLVSTRTQTSASN